MLLQAAYHGVPVVGLPFFADQPANAGKIVAKVNNTCTALPARSVPLVYHSCTMNCAWADGIAIKNMLTPRLAPTMSW